MDGSDVRLEGLTILVDPPGAELDVVFVHGFTGHPRDSWTCLGEVLQRDDKVQEDDCCKPPSKIRRFLDSKSSRRTSSRADIYWPKDILPTTLPNARIMTHGYDSNIRHRLGTPTSKSTLYDLGYELLLSLEAKRNSTPDRPLIFVAHSLGGIIVKEALRRGEGCRKNHNHLYTVYNATVGLICFGTPHCGADLRAIVYRVADTALRVGGFSMNNQLLDSMLPSSDRLRELRDEFSKMSREKNWVLYSFQEQYGLKILNGNKVVEDGSSNFGDSTIEIVQHISSDHMGMCCFKGFADVEYEKVDAAFHRICKVKGISTNTETSDQFIEPITVEEPIKEEDRRDCMNSLSFQQIDSRFLNIKRAHERTCNWLFDQLEYKRWMHTSLSSDYNGFLWIKGKPAAGKSTIMKHALLQVKKTMPKAIIISFFFNARGGTLEKTTLGMYRSLLRQLLEVPTLQDVITRIFKKKMGRKDGSEWTTNELQDALLSTIQSLQHQRLICFIDALDECAEKEVRAMVEFLEDLGEAAVSCGVFLNICLSSRHYPHITIRKALQLIVEGQDGHVDDITTYVESKFHATPSEEIDEIKAEILVRASGVFLWVILVVQMLNKAYDHGQVHAMRRRLNEIPDELDDLFADILTRDEESRDESILCLQWLLFSERPLRKDELYFAILSGTDSIEAVKLNPYEINHEVIDRFIISCSKGLAEVSKAKDETVQFIHECVRDFFIYRNGLAKLQANLAHDVIGLSHSRLTECCDRYVTVVINKYFDGFFRSKYLTDHSSFRFLQYSVENIFRHSDSAQGCGISQRDFLKLFPHDGRKLSNLINLSDSYSTENKIKTYGGGAELLYIFSDQNLPNLVRFLLDDGAKIDAYGNPYRTAIQAAAARGNQEVFQCLLTAGANINIKGGKHGHTLAAAIAGRNEDIVLMLQGMNIEVGQDILDKSLLESVKWGNELSMEFLLDLGANPNGNHGYKSELPRWDDSYANLLQLAIDSNQEAPVRVLLKRRVDKRPLNRVMLQNCIERGVNVAIVAQLLDHGIDPFKAYGDGWTALTTAAAKEAEAIVQFLLQRPGADPDLMARDIETSLFYARQAKHEKIIQLLEEAKQRYVNRVSPLEFDKTKEVTALAREKEAY